MILTSNWRTYIRNLTGISLFCLKLHKNWSPTIFNDHLVVKRTLAVLFCLQVFRVAPAVLLSTPNGSSLVNEGFVSFILLCGLNCQPFYLPLGIVERWQLTLQTGHMYIDFLRLLFGFFTLFATVAHMQVVYAMQTAEFPSFNVWNLCPNPANQTPNSTDRRIHLNYFQFGECKVCFIHVCVVWIVSRLTCLKGLERGDGLRFRQVTCILNFYFGIFMLFATVVSNCRCQLFVPCKQHELSPFMWKICVQPCWSNTEL